MGFLRKIFGDALHSDIENSYYRASYTLFDGLRILQSRHGIDVRTPTYRSSDLASGVPRYQGVPVEGLEEVPELYLSIEAGLRRVDLFALHFVRAYGFEPYREFVRKKCLAGMPVASMRVSYPFGSILQSDTVVSAILESFKWLSLEEDTWRSKIGHATRLKDGFWARD